MDMYVRMYDELKKAPDDNPTIGIVPSFNFAYFVLLQKSKE